MCGANSIQFFSKICYNLKLAINKNLYIIIFFCSKRVVFSTCQKGLSAKGYDVDPTKLDPAECTKRDSQMISDVDDDGSGTSCVCFSRTMWLTRTGICGQDV